jgi:hypothetical protein
MDITLNPPRKEKGSFYTCSIRARGKYVYLYIHVTSSFYEGVITLPLLYDHLCMCKFTITFTMDEGHAQNARLRPLVL